MRAVALPARFDQVAATGEAGYAWLKLDRRTTNLAAARFWPRHRFRPIAYRLHPSRRGRAHRLGARPRLSAARPVGRARTRPAGPPWQQRWDTGSRAQAT